jgi:hypothetical protein
MRERKRLIRLLVTDVTLLRDDVQKALKRKFRPGPYLPGDCAQRGAFWEDAAGQAVLEDGFEPVLVYAVGLFVLNGWVCNPVGMLGVDDVIWLAPVACGDTIRCEIDVLQVRLPKDSARGVVVMRHRVLNRYDAVVLRYRSARSFATSRATPDGAGS